MGEIKEFQVFSFFSRFLLKSYRLTVSLQSRVWGSGAESRPVLIEVVEMISEFSEEGVDGVSRQCGLPSGRPWA